LQPAIVTARRKVGRLGRERVARARGMVQLAKETGLTREGLYKALSKDGNPSLGTVLKVLKALGLKFTPQVA